MDENQTCFVPDCNSGVGVLFPKDDETKLKWLKALRLEQLEPDAKSFICLEHFAEDGRPMEKQTLVTPSTQARSIAAKKTGKGDSMNHQNKESCRLCLSQVQVNDDVFEALDNGLTPAYMIEICIQPLKVSPKDSFSKKICRLCSTNLKHYYKFYNTCIETAAKQRDFVVEENYESDEYLEEWLSEEDKLNQKKKHKIKNGNCDQSVIDKISSLSSISITKNAPVVVKEEPTEDIVIEMIDDDSDKKANDGPVIVRKIHKKGIKRKRIVVEKEKLIDICEDGVQDLEVSEPEDVKSDLGTFEAQEVEYVFGYKYLYAGGYLYERRLIKDDIRRLKCIVNTCKSTACQKRLEYDKYEPEIHVLTSHNHKRPNDDDRREQMFYHILFSKMCREKNFNFKMLYEEFCRQDKLLSTLLPLRVVIREICKQGPAIAPKPFTSFDEFYEKFEDEQYSKFHYTQNGAQFFQEKFALDYGGKAVVFANQEVLERVSDSALMFVDSSFVIESEDFPYQLTTVLLWTSEGYYPVLFAFINQKCQEVYKKIFGHLHDVLAPRLRPHEIITEYEANLYYALAETYVESSIGGSLFYYAQNIYKKVCDLDLATTLEVNTKFRNFFTMLLMLPLLPVNTILDGFNNIELQAKQQNMDQLMQDLFVHIYDEWISKVTPDLFCVHKLDNRMGDNIAAPFKKMRDLLLTTKRGKVIHVNNILRTMDVLLDVEKCVRENYSSLKNKSDLTMFQKKHIVKAWEYIENHPMINIDQFFLKVMGYIKCMENQLWLWGYYKYQQKYSDNLIDANNFSIVDDINQVTINPKEEILEDDTEIVENVEQEQILEEYHFGDNGEIRKIVSSQGGLQCMMQIQF